MTNNIQTFTNLTPEQLKQFLESKFPNDKFTFELCLYTWNSETVVHNGEKKEKLISIPFNVEIYFEDPNVTHFGIDYVNFVLEFPNDTLFDTENEVEEYVDKIHYELGKYCG